MEYQEENSETNLNSNMELLIFLLWFQFHSWPHQFKFQYGATNIFNGGLTEEYSARFKFQYGATNISYTRF